MRTFIHLSVVVVLSGCLFSGKGCSKSQVSSFADVLSEMKYYPTPYNQLSAGYRDKVTANRYSRCTRWYGRQKGADFHRFFYTSQGQKVAGILGQPKDLDEKHPLLIINRNGYGDLGIINVCDLRSLFSPFIRKKFIVIATQLKGSDQGTGKSDLGEGDVTDVKTLTDVIFTLPYVDKKNIFMIGTGRGGVTALRTAASGMEVNAVGVASVPWDFRTFHKEHPDIAESHFAKVIPDYPKDLQAKLESRSVLSFIDKVKVPIIAFHGEDDEIVDVANGRKLAKKLSSLNPKNKYIEYPDAGHRFGSARGEMIQEILVFFESFKK